METPIEVMRSLRNIHVETNSENNNEEETSKHISFCIVILKSTVLIADKITTLRVAFSWTFKKIQFRRRKKSSFEKNQLSAKILEVHIFNFWCQTEI